MLVMFQAAHSAGGAATPDPSGQASERAHDAAELSKSAASCGTAGLPSAPITETTVPRMRTRRLGM